MSNKWMSEFWVLLGLYIIYFKQYNTYHDIHEVIFDIYQRYILSGFRQNKIDISTKSQWILRLLMTKYSKFMQSIV